MNKINLDFVKLAIQVQIARLRESLSKINEHDAKIPCPGLGDLGARVRLDGTEIVVRVNKVDDEVLDRDIVVIVNKENKIKIGEYSSTNDDKEKFKKAINKRNKIKKEREPIVERNKIIWYLVKDISQPGRELKERKANGEEVWGNVDTEKFCYKMVCNCGVERFAKPQDLGQITKCRPCTKKDRKKRHAIRQRQRRKKNASK